MPQGWGGTSAWFFLLSLIVVIKCFCFGCDRLLVTTRGRRSRSSSFHVIRSLPFVTTSFHRQGRVQSDVHMTREVNSLKEIDLRLRRGGRAVKKFCRLVCADRLQPA